MIIQDKMSIYVPFGKFSIVDELSHKKNKKEFSQKATIKIYTVIVFKKRKSIHNSYGFFFGHLYVNN